MSSPELVMIEAACFQLRTALAEVQGENYATPARIALNVLAGHVEAAKRNMNTSAVNDIEFALNDLIAAADELPADVAARVDNTLKMLRGAHEQLRKHTALPKDVLDAIAELQAKLRLRRDAIEKQTFREDVGDLTLPHPPDALKPEALPIREKLRAAGFATPALDVLIDHPSEFLFHSINELMNELEVIVGG